MATLTVETGSGSATATSYVSAATFATYNTERSVTLTANNGDASEVLIKAMDYIESQIFKGTKNSDDQRLVWPRWGVVVDGYYVDNDSIPLLLQEAQMDVAIGIDGGNNPLANIGRETKKEKVDVIEVEYMEGALNQTYLKSAETKLRKLLKSTYGAFRV